MMLTSAAISNGLGIVASGKRAIRSGHEYNRYFNTSELTGTDPIIGGKKSTNFDTLRAMEMISKKYSHQTEKISKKLKGNSLGETLNNIWDFLYNNIQYRLDSKTREQVRQPLRSWKDRKQGIDCDCFSVFISSILNNLGISHAFRMAKYSKDYQHVYVVVPKDGKQSSLDIAGKYYTVDPVVDQFNYEVPFTGKHDRFMEIQMLNGLGATAERCLPNSKQYIYYERATQYKEKGLLIATEFLTANKIEYTPKDTTQGFGYEVKAGPFTMVVRPVITPQQGQDILSAIEKAKNIPATTMCDEKQHRKSLVKWIAWLLGISTAIIILDR